MLIDLLARNTDVTRKEIARLPYRNKHLYRSFQLRAGKKSRTIDVPIPSLKSVQDGLKEFLEQKLEVHDAAHGYVRGRSIVTHATMHLGKDTYFKTDIRDCFGSISSFMVASIFREAGFSPQDVFLATRLTTFNGHLPQGASTSPLLCNLVLRPVDRSIYALCQKLGATYSRYGDDIAISGDDLVPSITKSVADIVQRNGFSAKAEKTYFARKPHQNIITGLSISSGYVRLRRQYKRDVRLESQLLLKMGPLEFSNSKVGFDPFAIDRVLGRLSWWIHVEPDAVFPKKRIHDVRTMLATFNL